MRTVLAFAAMLLLLANPAAAQPDLRGRLESLPSEGLIRWFLCVTAQGVEVGQCPPDAALVRISIVHAVAEIRLAASGNCLGTEGMPTPGARVTAVPCGGQLWRADAEHFHWTLGNLCLEAQPVASGQSARAVLQPCQTVEGAGAARQRWILDPDW